MQSGRKSAKPSGTVVERPLPTLGVNRWQAANKKQCPLQIRKRISPFICRGETHFGAQKMSKSQKKEKIGEFPDF